MSTGHSCTISDEADSTLETYGIIHYHSTMINKAKVIGRGLH